MTTPEPGWEAEETTTTHVPIGEGVIGGVVDTGGRDEDDAPPRR